MTEQDVRAFLRKSVPLFAGFPAERIAELVAGSRHITFEPNEAILSFGEEGRFLGVMLEGEAEVSVTDDGGQKHRVAVLKSGEVFGEMSLMTGDRTTADVIGLVHSAALLIPHELFSTILITNPAAVKHLSKTISERLKRSAERHEAESALRRSDDPYGFRLRTATPMKVLTVNCGSSSLKYNLFDTADEARNARGVIERIGEPRMKHTHRSGAGEWKREIAGGGHAEAFRAMVDALTSRDGGVLSSAGEVNAVGHRVVHGGDAFAGPELVTDAVLAKIDELSTLAPLHNPVNATGIREARRCFPAAAHVAVFDTSFHHTLPPYAYLYGLPYELYEKDKVRRYGFHGMSHAYVALKAAEFLKRPFNELQAVSCHLGNGASVCAIDHGRSIDTSMGFTPAEGLVMGTRSGSVDPAILPHLMRTAGMGADDLDALINRRSGLKGLSGVSNDMREIEAAADAGNLRALTASKVFSYGVRKYIGAYVAAMGGCDVVIFTGGIGQGSHGVRGLACQGLGYMGIRIDEGMNREARGFEKVCDISTPDSPVRVLVVPTDEERMIARETLRVVSTNYINSIIQNQRNKPVPIEISAHHVHLTQEHVEALFGPGNQLTTEFELSQPGQFACAEKVNLVGPKGRVDRVRVLGPARKETQVEISMTEQFKLGIHPPIRESGDVKDTPGLVLEGPRGSVAIERGVICALRHIHMSPEEALGYGLRDKHRVRVRVKGRRDLTFGDVLIRVHPNFRLAMHIDTDEGNAGNVGADAVGYIEGIQSQD
jgi:acetate kinase